MGQRAPGWCHGLRELGWGSPWGGGLPAGVTVSGSLSGVPRGAEGSWLVSRSQGAWVGFPVGWKVWAGVVVSSFSLCRANAAARLTIPLLPGFPGGLKPLTWN